MRRVVQGRGGVSARGLETQTEKGTLEGDRARDPAGVRNLQSYSLGGPFLSRLRRRRDRTGFCSARAPAPAQLRQQAER